MEAIVNRYEDILEYLREDQDYSFEYEDEDDDESRDDTVTHYLDSADPLIMEITTGVEEDKRKNHSTHFYLILAIVALVVSVVLAVFFALRKLLNQHMQKKSFYKKIFVDV